MYKEPVNSPFVSTVQKDIMQERDVQKKPRKEFSKSNKQDQEGIVSAYYQQEPGPKQKPLVDLQVWEASKPRAPKPPLAQALRDIDPALYVPAYTTAPQFPPQWQASAGYGYPPWMYNPAQYPIIKNYSINVAGPSADHQRVSAIYEDILPAKQFNSTSNTLGERLNIYDFVRSVFIKQGDGEDIDIDGSGKNSLLSYLKFMELNPYHTSHFTDNPYISLPDDMLIYRSCYPVRYDRNYQQVECAPNSIGMNIRIYKLTFAEYFIKKNQRSLYHEYDVWREVAYYEYMREHILKKKVCPNFVLMYAYYIIENCNVDFDKIKRIKGEWAEKEPMIKPPFITEYEKKKQRGVPNTIGERLEKAVEVVAIQDNNQLLKPVEGEPKTLEYEMQINPNAFSGRGLLALTESPNYNIYGWSSKTYEVAGNIRKMVNPGYHTAEIWYSVLFQMIVALYVLQINKLAFRDFSLKDNVYIKDISMHEHITTYWKYVVDGVEYYIPNHGYLTLVDSNFKNIKRPETTLLTSKNNKKYKIYSNMYVEDGGMKYNDDQLNNYCFAAFANAVNPNEFSKSFTNIGGSKPPEEVMDLLNRIYAEASSSGANKDIGYYIYTYMRRFIHNRVGTVTKEHETKNVRKDDHTPFHKGEILVHEFQYDTYKFVVFLGADKGFAQVLTKDDPTKGVVEKKVPVDQLFNYSKYEPIAQTYKPNEANLAEEDLLETYTISKN